MAATPPPQLPPSPPTDWPAAPTGPDVETGAEPGWLATRAGEREAWTGWQVAVVTVVALLAGLAIGVALGVRIGDRDGAATRSAATSFETTPPPAGGQAPTTGGNETIGDHLGSPSNPVPPGTTVILGGYSLAVLAVDPEAAGVVARTSDLNVAPGPNRSYLLITVELTYDGPLRGDPIEVLLSALDREGGTYLQLRDSCGRIPDELSRHAEMAPGSSVTGNVCFSVPTDRVPGMVLVAEVLAGYAVHYRLGT